MSIRLVGLEHVLNQPLDKRWISSLIQSNSVQSYPKIVHCCGRNDILQQPLQPSLNYWLKTIYQKPCEVKEGRKWTGVIGRSAVQRCHISSLGVSHLVTIISKSEETGTSASGDWVDISLSCLYTQRYWLGYFHKSWIFRSFAAANNVICEGHCTSGVMPNIHSCANSVMNLSGKTSPFPRGYFASRGLRDDPP